VPDAAGLTAAKLALRKSLDELWEETQADVKQRVG
jgi:hypothetical protein